MNILNEVRKILHDGNSAIDHRVKEDTERYRKGFARIVLKEPVKCGPNDKRQPIKEIKGAKVEYELIRHEFMFGCNAFLMGEFPSEEQNLNYEKRFAELFNLAVAPFYWDAYEPEQGKPRDDINSPKVYRRPAPELIMNFCEKYNLYAKLHCLSYRNFEPKWLPKNSRDYLWELEQHYKHIAERYGKRIRIWDVVNELYSSTTSQDHHPLDYIERSLSLAQKYLPENAIKVVNEATNAAWYHASKEFTPFATLCDNFKKRGYKFDWAGLQYHMFKKEPEALLRENYAKLYRRQDVLQYLDGYIPYNLPMHVSEITIPGIHGDDLQAELAEHLYRVWFSHPLMRGIVWWNFVDRTAHGAPMGEAGGENKTKAGLINYDFSEKKIFTVLKRLIHQEWSTKGCFDYKRTEEPWGLLASPNKFHGFFGDYKLNITLEDGRKYTKNIFVSQESGNKFELELD